LKNVVVGTAGHIDHGKTLLVRALTGTDADRLAEEKRRGITIDIGFAVLRENGLLVHFVDLPGHEKFIKNMLAGATGIDFFLLVVAADESVMPQTVEHLEIMKFLGIRRGVVALNKVDKVDGETAEIARLETEALLERNGFQGARIVKVSAKSGEGLEDLRKEILGEASASGARDPFRPFRMPIDRIFSIRGFGTVVTGTSTSGVLRLGDTLAFYPSMLRSKVRSIEVFREKKESASGGERVAVNVPDVVTDEMERGETAAAADSMFPARFFFCSVDAPGHVLKSSSEFLLHVGTMEVPVRLAFPSDRDGGGGPLIAQIRSREELALWSGDRFILRLPSPLRTVGGGTILLPTPRRAKWHAPRTAGVVAVLRSAGEGAALLALLSDNGERGASSKEASQRLGFTTDRAAGIMASLAGEGRAVSLANDEWWIDSGEFENLEKRAVNYLGKRHEGPPVRPNLGKEEFFSHFSRLLPEKWTEALLGHLEKKGSVVVEKDKVRLASFETKVPEEDRLRIAAMMASLDRSFPVPLSREELLGSAGGKSEWALNLIRSEGRVVSIKGEFFFSKDGYRRILSMLREFAKAGHREFAVPEFKDFFGMTRRTAIPLLEHFDGEGMTRRIGDRREIIAKGDPDEAG